MVSANKIEILRIAESDAYVFADVDDLGVYKKVGGYIEKHIDDFWESIEGRRYLTR